MNKQRLFPNRKGSNRSCYFTVKPGEVALLCGFFPDCVSSSICVNKVFRDCCKCIHQEKEFCQLGCQAGIDNENCEGAIVMPGEYVAIFEWDQKAELPDPEEWGIYVDIVPALENLKTLALVANVGDC